MIGKIPLDKALRIGTSDWTSTTRRGTQSVESHMRMALQITESWDGTLIGTQDWVDVKWVGFQSIVNLMKMAFI